jgi:hypothetical protein
MSTKFLAVEINPILVLMMTIRRIFHPNKKNIKIILADIFKLNLKSQIIKLKTKKQFNNLTIYLYLSPWFLEKVMKNLTKQLKGKNFLVVSYFYPLSSKKPKKVLKGKNKIFVYVMNSFKQDSTGQ